MKSQVDFGETKESNQMVRDGYVGTRAAGSQHKVHRQAGPEPVGVRRGWTETFSPMTRRSTPMAQGRACRIPGLQGCQSRDGAFGGARGRRRRVLCCCWLLVDDACVVLGCCLSVPNYC